MKTCPYCGEQNDQRHRFCTVCGQSLAVPDAVFPSSGPRFDPTTGRPSNQAELQTPFEITLAHGEVLKRVFEIARVHRPFGWLYGHLVVTDSRVIYRARSKNWLNQSVNNSEIQVADVSGIRLATRRGITLLNVFTIAFGTLIAWSFVGGFQAVSSLLNAYSSLSFGSRVSTPNTSGWSVFLSLLVLLVAILFFIVRMRSAEVTMVIAARNVSESPIAFSGSVGRGGFGLYRAFVSFLVSPLLAFGWALGIRDSFDISDATMIPATERLYEEFGALILDLQSRGVLGDE